MSFINQFKSQSKTVLAAVAISAATLGFAGGMSISKSSAGVSTQSQASLAQNNSAATNGQVAASANTQGMPPGQGGAPQGMSPGQGGAPQDMPPGQGGVPQGMPPGQGGASQGMLPGQGGPSQGTTPPDATSGATQSNSSTSSDEVNALKEKNQEIKAQISGDSSSSNQ
ncbi:MULTISPECIES: hypothetical protein [Streptococcus]|uniref:hypothetical protein n=1 Tax=Streptococcus TaxID=1301 RepID=UPI000407FF93|nr:hypothetical protein [Streptococcus suis]AWX97340.1 hypothetical protein BKM67_04590 [Streptococcus suis]NQI76062.1 hypothetical protein [Streptococcus suis]NQI78520.1 hypothetical protein [Streptococcus suis]NQI81926.1 hypothetical protein [Streptococcus suis]NQL17669.1 hypothetical protein [Streptococcus suis]